jgi:L-ectoine synthase
MSRARAGKADGFCSRPTAWVSRCHDTVVKEGTEQRLHYKHHLEANYCIAGEGEVVDVRTGKTYPIRPGTLYALDEHDEHILRARAGDLRLVCIFNPPLAGPEKHRPDGSYAPGDTES